MSLTTATITNGTISHPINPHSQRHVYFRCNVLLYSVEKRIQARWLDTTLPAKRKKTTGKRKYKHPTNDTKACLVIFDHFRRRRRRRQTSCSPKEREKIMRSLKKERGEKGGNKKGESKKHRQRKG